MMKSRNAVYSVLLNYLARDVCSIVWQYYFVLSSISEEDTKVIKSNPPLSLLLGTNAIEMKDLIIILYNTNRRIYCVNINTGKIQTICLIWSAEFLLKLNKSEWATVSFETRRKNTDIIHILQYTTSWKHDKVYLETASIRSQTLTKMLFSHGLDSNEFFLLDNENRIYRVYKQKDSWMHTMMMDKARLPPLIKSCISFTITPKYWVFQHTQDEYSSFIYHLSFVDRTSNLVIHHIDKFCQGHHKIQYDPDRNEIRAWTEYGNIIICDLDSFKCRKLHRPGIMVMNVWPSSLLWCTLPISTFKSITKYTWSKQG